MTQLLPAVRTQNQRVGTCGVLNSRGHFEGLSPFGNWGPQEDSLYEIPLTESLLLQVCK